MDTTVRSHDVVMSEKNTGRKSVLSTRFIMKSIIRMMIYSFYSLTGVKQKDIKLQVVNCPGSVMACFGHRRGSVESFRTIHCWL